MGGELVSVRPFGGALGAEIVAVGMSSAPPSAVGEALFHALAQYGVLTGSLQSLGLGSLAELAALFGPRVRVSELSSGMEEVERAPERMALMTDPFWRVEVPFALLLHAEELPSGGGESIWSSLAAAYDGLSVPLRRYLSALAAAHESRAGREVWRPLVDTHPLTSRACLGLSPDFTSRLGGVPDEEGEAILGLLRNLIYMPENQIRLPWAPGMFALWDCRLAHHYAVGGFAAGGWRFGGFSLHADLEAASLRTG